MYTGRLGVSGARSNTVQSIIRPSMHSSSCRECRIVVLALTLVAVPHFFHAGHLQPKGTCVGIWTFTTSDRG